VSVVETLAAGRLFQVAFIVRDLDAALERYSAMLGAGPWRCWTLHSRDHTGEEYMGGPTDYVTRLALTSGDEMQLELVQPVKGPSVHEDWLNEHGEGFHHLGYVVDSVADTIAEMAKAGYPVIQGATGFGASGDGVYAYFDTRPELGTIVEAVQPPTRMPEPDFVWSAPG
jgi:catechol 2,3-dioxygenase-like lactoylglutathione lyase family enzyme